MTADAIRVEHGFMPSTVTRPRQTGRGLVLAVTGAGEGIGPAVTRRLVEDGRFSSILAVGPSTVDESALPGVRWALLDPCAPQPAGVLAAAFKGIDVIVHLAIGLGAGDRRDRNVRGTQALLDAAAAAGVSRLVVVTSAMVYGARPENPLPLADSAPVQAIPEDSLLGDLVEVERLVAAHAGRPKVTVLRPATVVGPGADGVITRHFEAPRLLMVSGAAPCWQFCHVDDLASAVALAAASGLPGPAAVGSPGWLSQEEVEALSGLRSLQVPEGIAVRTVERLRRAGVTPAQASELAFHIHPWVVGCDRLRAAGWEPTYDNASALTDQLTRNAHRLALGGARVTRETANRAAAGAGATMALVGTAAMVRAARRRRHKTR